MSFNKSNLNSIITNKLTSLFLEYRLSIDKVDFILFPFLTIEYLVQHWKSIGLPYSKFTSVNKQHGIQCLNIGFLIQPRSTDSLYKITSNPKNYDSYEKYLKVLKKVLPSDVYRNMLICGIDLAFDIYNLDFHFINQRLLVSRKRLFERVVEESYLEATRYFGGGAEKFRFYGKKARIENSRKQRTPSDLKILGHKLCNRIEVSLSGKKIQKKTLSS